MRELFNLDGKTILITGASSGLGKQFAKTLSKAGASVILVGRNEARLSELQSVISVGGGKAQIIQCDLDKKEDIATMVHQAAKSGPIDVLINCAGIACLTPVTQLDQGEFDQHYRTNLRAVWLTIQYVVQHMIERKVDGSIINIASINGADAPYTKASAYSCSKAAVIQLTKQLVAELSPHNIRINAILPGLFQTEMTLEKIKAKGDELSTMIPLQRIAKPEELDGAILLLSSNLASSYMTGSVLTVDGESVPIAP